jgi:hypothetical protein
LRTEIVMDAVLPVVGLVIAGFVAALAIIRFAKSDRRKRVETDDEWDHRQW